MITSLHMPLICSKTLVKRAQLYSVYLLTLLLLSVRLQSVITGFWSCIFQSCIFHLVTVGPAFSAFVLFFVFQFSVLILPDNVKDLNLSCVGFDKF